MKENEIKHLISRCLKDMQLAEAYCKEHILKKEDFFYDGSWVYCRKCNLPMDKMITIMYYCCSDCGGVIPHIWIYEKRN